MFSSLILLIFAFVINFNTNHYQIGAPPKSSRELTCFAQPQNGTSLRLKEIFLGRCYDYIYNEQKENCEFDSKKYDCNLIWETFNNITLRKSCSINDYTPLLNLADHPIPVDRSLFWSGTYTSAHQYTKTHRYWSLEDTLIGRLMDGLVFCVGSQQFDYMNSNCSRDCQFWTFWNAASKRFAEKANGSIQVVLNGTRPAGAITNTSTFYTQELPNFKNVKKLTVLLLHNPNGNKVETCASGASLKDLQRILKEKNITYECKDNPKDILFFMCFEDPLSKECQSIKFSIEYDTDAGISTIANKMTIFITATMLLLYNLF